MNPSLFDRLAMRLINATLRRKPRPDFVIGGDDHPYMFRWWLTPWSGYGKSVREENKTFLERVASRLPGIYLHCIMRPDDDRALHDHPWPNVSLVLRGKYIEHTIERGGIHRRVDRVAGSVTARRAKAAHRLELHGARSRYEQGMQMCEAFGLPHDDAARNCADLSREPIYDHAWSLFFFGFRTREWGFHCPERGWVHWRAFTSPTDAGAIGNGCDA